MIRRLVEAHYFQYREKPSPAQIKFWFQELRTPQLLLELAQTHKLLCRRLAPQRPLLAHAALGESAPLDQALATEEAVTREQDRVYWLPLRQELEKLRHSK